MRAKRTGTDVEEAEPDINSIVVVGGARHSPNRRPPHRDGR